ncbi:hypothetical protein [Endozoicomonas arenosclerae]|uniref:hypothetical protein n=1 Tax=Endozoicomonas arenosclerae TaxID=1633495 RepID=UPI000784E798|nr:hypothetical protein [Endozoicomonas arenosclerae]
MTNKSGLPAVVLIALTYFTSEHAQAGTGWYVTIVNNYSEELLIHSSGNDNWYCNDFCSEQRIEPGGQRTFYTEEKERSRNNAAIQGLDFNGTHVELYQGGHSYTGTQIASTPVYTSFFLDCIHYSEAGISSSHTSAVRVDNMFAGSSDACLNSGGFGTVHTTIRYTGN